MATTDIKEYLFDQTGVPAVQWKRLSKSKSFDGSEVRVFEDKSSGKIVETVELNGVISIVESGASPSIKESSESAKSNDDSQMKKALSLIKKYYKEQEEIDESKAGFNEIPKYFKFCFLEDGNPDHSVAIKDAANNSNAKVAVTGFNIFFYPNFKSSEGSIHLSALLEPYLPDFLSEVEEQTFCIHEETMTVYDDERITGITNGTIPSIPYDQFISTLETMGFIYDINNCMLKNLGGSKGALPLIEEVGFKEVPSFCMVLVKNKTFDPNRNYDNEYLTALVMNTPQTTKREVKEKIINKTLKKYNCMYPGRLMNGNFPQLELFQLVKKTNPMFLNEKDRQKVYDMLTEMGWTENRDLASEENAKKWTLEQWAITPMPKSPFVIVDSGTNKIGECEHEIEYSIWKSSSPKLKI